MDSVNHPSHYNQGEIETIAAIWDWGYGPDFCVGNSIKYLSRFKHKQNPLEDLKKARWYLDYLIDRLEDQNEKS